MSSKIFVNEYFVRIEAMSTDIAFQQLISNCPRIEKSRKRNEYFCSLELLPAVLHYLRGINSHEECPDGFIKDKYKEVETRETYTALLKQYGPTQTDEFLWPHQSLGVELAEVNKRYGFFYDTRTGKTLMALKIMYNALKRNDAKRCLVVCQSSIIPTWVEDAKRYPELVLTTFYGKDKWEAIHKPAHIIIWSMEQVLDNLELLKAAKFDLCFVDESSKMKNHKSKISGALLELSKTIPRWYLLSGTPAPNNESEYYVQMQSIDPYCFPTARSRFKERYFNDKSRDNRYEILKLRNDKSEEFFNIISKYSIYVDQSVMPMAGKVWHQVYFDIADELKVTYNTMREEKLIEVEEHDLSAKLAASVRSKLNQISSGFIMDTDAIKFNKLLKKLQIPGNNIESYVLSDYRIQELDKLIEHIGRDERLIVWANFHEEFAMLENYFGLRARYLKGGVGQTYREDSIAAFKRGEVQHLVCHPQSVGLGINLAESHNAIYYSCSDSWESLKQSSERIAGHISVQPHECHYYVMIANDTVDELIYKNVSNKRDASFGLLEHLKAEALR